MRHDLPLLERSRELARRLERFSTLQAVRAAGDGPDLLEQADDLLLTLREHRAPDLAARAADTRSLQVVHWNIEHGNRYDAVERALLEHPELRDADLVSLNEADLGMARSGNRDVAFDLARALHLHAVWAPMFLELGVGRHDDARFAAGARNREALFGLALLSRHPFGRARIVALPSPVDLHFEWERMFGRHVALVAEVKRPRGELVAVTTHLEVHRLPGHRRAQMEVLLAGLAGEPRPVVIAGDFNTSTLPRGRPRDGLAGLATLALTPRDALRRRLLHPDEPAEHPREPLFAALGTAGFRWDACNDREPTLLLRFERLGEVEALPGALRRVVLGALSGLSARARLRLDWIAARGFRAAAGRTVPGLDRGPAEASDHAPIVARLELPAGA